MAFPITKLKNDEPRAEYIRRRHAEGATDDAILAEINGPELYSGPDGKQWKMLVVFEALKAVRKAARAAPPPAPEPARDERSHEERIDTLELTAEEKAALDVQAFDDVAADRKEQLRREYLTKAKARLRAQEGLRTGNPHLDELVWHTINLPDGSPCHIINRTPFYHGQTVHLPRHVVDSMREVEHRCWQNEARREGKAVDFYTRSHTDRASGKATWASRNERVGSADIGKSFVPGVAV